MAKVGTLVTGNVATAADVNSGFAAWTTYSPTYANIGINNGVVVAKYTQAGRITFVKWQLTLGTTTTIGSNPSVSLPVAAADSVDLLGSKVYLEDAGVQIYPGFGGGSPFKLYAMAAGGTYTTFTALTSTIPFTWGTGDSVAFSVVYEATS